MTSTSHERQVGQHISWLGLCNHWVHSREEDTDGLEVFRPEGFVFPPSRGRDGFEIKADGEFIQEEIGPADTVVRIRGQWKSSGPRRVVVWFPSVARESYSFEIVAAGAGVLQIRRDAQQAARKHRQRPDIPPTQPSHGDCRNWAAWVDRQPPGPPALHVTGECEFPTGGFTVGLRRHEPQGFNPRDLLLDKIVTPPDGPAATAATTVGVRYDEETTSGFDTVTILPDGPSIPVTETS